MIQVELKIFSRISVCLEGAFIFLFNLMFVAIKPRSFVVVVVTLGHGLD